MPQNLFTPPPGEPGGMHFAVGPGPLSPAWPRAAEPEPPNHELLELVSPLKALKRECLMALAEQTPLLLGREERVALLAAFERLRAANATLPGPLRLASVAAWPSPVLPEGALFGARDLLPLLGGAMLVASVVAEREISARNWVARAPLFDAAGA